MSAVDTRPTYDEALDAFLAALELERGTERRMLATVPGSAEGKALYDALMEQQRETSRLKRVMHNAVGAPPQG